MNELHIEPSLLEDQKFEEISKESKRYKYFQRAKEEIDN